MVFPFQRRGSVREEVFSVSEFFIDTDDVISLGYCTPVGLL